MESGNKRNSGNEFLMMSCARNFYSSWNKTVVNHWRNNYEFDNHWILKKYNQPKIMDNKNNV